MSGKDYRLNQNMDWAQPVLTRAAPKSSEIQAAWLALVANIDRADALTASFPLIVSAISTYDKAHTSVMARFYLQGIPKPTAEHTSIAHEVAMNALKEFGEYMLQYHEGYRGPHLYAHVMPQSYALIQWAAVTHGNLEASLEAMLGAQVINLWTAFEALSEDLWNALLDARPSRLQVKKRRPLPSLLRVRDAYAEVFGMGDRYFSTPLSSVDVEALAAVRNVLVHAGGVVDSMFVDKHPLLPPELRLPLGATVSLDGALVYKMTVPVIAVCISLIDAADRWLTDHR